MGNTSHLCRSASHRHGHWPSCVSGAAPRVWFSLPAPSPPAPHGLPSHAMAPSPEAHQQEHCPHPRSRPDTDYAEQPSPKLRRPQPPAELCLLLPCPWLPPCSPPLTPLRFEPAFLFLQTSKHAEPGKQAILTLAGTVRPRFRS